VWPKHSATEGEAFPHAVAVARAQNDVDAVIRPGDDDLGRDIGIIALWDGSRPTAAASGREIQPISQETREVNSSDWPPAAPG
jgi:hypothetical protein